MATRYHHLRDWAEKLLSRTPGSGRLLFFRGRDLISKGADGQEVIHGGGAVTGIADVPGLTEALSDKANATAVATSLNAKADLVAGKVPMEQIPDGLGGGASGLPASIVSVFAGLKNLNPIGFQLQTIASPSNVDVYTVPAGKVAVVGASNIFNNGLATSANFILKAKIGTDYRIVGSLNVGANSGNTFQSSFLFQAGETIAYQSQTSTTMVTLRVFEADRPDGLYVNDTTTFVAGDNVIAVAPVGKRLVIAGAPGVSTLTAASAILYSNETGASRPVYLNVYPTGGSAGTLNRIGGTATVANLAASATGTSVTLNPGDSLSLNTTSNAMGQFARVVALEFSV